MAEPWAGGRPTGRPGAASGAGTAALRAPLGALSAHRHRSFRGPAAMKASQDAMSAISTRTPPGRKLMPCCLQCCNTERFEPYMTWCLQGQACTGATTWQACIIEAEGQGDFADPYLRGRGQRRRHWPWRWGRQRGWRLGGNSAGWARRWRRAQNGLGHGLGLLALCIACPLLGDLLHLRALLWNHFPTPISDTELLRSPS